MMLVCFLFTLWGKADTCHIYPSGLFGSRFKHTHYLYRGGVSNYATLHLASIPIPSGGDLLEFTTLPLDLDTDQGKKVCQQVFMDMGRYWAGDPVDYLALYVRDW